MQRFEYKARSVEGQVVAGNLLADDRSAAAHNLRSRQLTPLSLTASTSSGPSAEAGGGLKRLWLRAASSGFMRSSGAETKAKGSCSGKGLRCGLSFLKRLLELNSSGMPVGDAVKTLSLRLRQPEQKALAQVLWQDLSEGASMAEAMRRQPQSFPVSIPPIIEAGEAAGQLAPVLSKVVAFMEEKQAMRRKMLASMMYPIFVCAVAVGVMLIFLFFLFPKVDDMLNKLGGEMHWSAQVLVAGTDWLIKGGPFLLIAVILGVIGVGQWWRTAKGRACIDRWLLRLPLIGGIVYYGVLFQTGALISTLFRGGVDTTEALRLTEVTIDNVELRERFHRARIEINEGRAISQAFEANDFLPELAVDLLAVGENTGNLSHSIDEVSISFKRELTERMQRLTLLVSTGALMGAFLMVSLVAVAIVTSVFQVSRTLAL